MSISPRAIRRPSLLIIGVLAAGCAQMSTINVPQMLHLPGQTSAPPAQPPTAVSNPSQGSTPIQASAQPPTPAEPQVPAQAPAQAQAAGGQPPPPSNPFGGFQGPHPYPVAQPKARLTDLGDTTYSVSLERFPSVARHQETDVWCWAACIQMIYLFRGESITQTAIVQRVAALAPGDDTNAAPVRGALQWEVMEALCPRETAQLAQRPTQEFLTKLNTMAITPPQRGKQQKIQVKVDTKQMLNSLKSMNFDSKDLVESISRGMPVMVSIGHIKDSGAHMYVIYGVTYTPTVDPMAIVAQGSAMSKHRGAAPASGDNQTYVVKGIQVVDPWTAKTDKMDGEFQARVVYMMSELSVKRTLTELSQSVQIR